MKSIVYDFTGIYDYFHIPHLIHDDLNINNPIHYYIDLRKKYNYKGKFDEEGIFLFFQNKTTGWFHFPISIFNYGIGAMQNYLANGEKTAFNRMIVQAEWAYNNQIKENKYEGGWQCNLDFPIYNLKSGWISALAQGLGISFLLRVWKLTKDKRFLESANLAVYPYYKLVEDGGMKVLFHNKYPFYEEYPSSSPSFVLNGFISSILGLRDLALFTNNQTADKLWKQGIATLKAILPYYDLGYWSRYDLYKSKTNIASRFYHQYHITQLKLLYMLTEEKIFNKYSEKFLSYYHNKLFRIKSLQKKIGWRIKRL